MVEIHLKSIIPFFLWLIWFWVKGTLEGKCLMKTIIVEVRGSWIELINCELCPRVNAGQGKKNDRVLLNHLELLPWDKTSCQKMLSSFKLLDSFLIPTTLVYALSIPWFEWGGMTTSISWNSYHRNQLAFTIMEGFLSKVFIKYEGLSRKRQ